MLENLEQRRMYSVTASIDAATQTATITGTGQTDTIYVQNYLHTLTVKSGGQTVYEGPNYLNVNGSADFLDHIVIKGLGSDDTITYWGDENAQSWIRTDVSIDGGDGNDTIDATAYDEQAGGTIHGGIGNDTIKLTETFSDHGNFDAYGDAGDDNFTLEAYWSQCTLHGGDGNDTMKDVTDPDNAWTGHVYYGDAGNDTIGGGGHEDLIFGGDGNDKLYGYAGNDTLCGGLGSDLLNGGTGIDIQRLVKGEVLPGQRGGDVLDSIEGQSAPISLSVY